MSRMICTQHVKEPQESLVGAIASAIADRERCDPTELTPPIENAIDCDALDDLCTRASSNVNVQFTYREYSITVNGEGKIAVE